MTELNWDFPDPLPPDVEYFVRKVAKDGQPSPLLDALPLEPVAGVYEEDIG